MDTNALINETLKYLERDENNKPKYRFDIYTSGVANYFYNQVSTLSKGLIKTEQIAEETIPVSVYTIGDVFNTISGTRGDIMKNIQALPGTLENIKVSLRQFGFTALDKTIDTIKAAVIPIEALQTMEEIYRVVRPLVQRIVNIASIAFKFQNAALVAQDVLQYLGRVAASTAKNFLSRLWDIFMGIPIFAIYENNNSVNLAEVYANLSNRADTALEDIVKNMDSIGELIQYINGSEKTMYEPKYNDLGIAIEDDIVDVFHNPNTREIFIASKHKIYKVDKNYTTNELYEVEDEIRRIYVYNGTVYYIVGDNKIVRATDDATTTISGGKLDIIFSNPVLLCNKTKFYTALGAEINVSANDLQYQCFDVEGNIIYFIDKLNGKYSLHELVVNSDGEWVNQLLAEDIWAPFGLFGMSYFDKNLYLIDRTGGEANDKYYLKKVSAGFNFSSTGYTFSGLTNNSDTKNIIWTDGTYATDGTNILQFSTLEDFKRLTFKAATDPINCITKVEYNSKNYFVCTGGINIYVTEIGSNDSYCWNKKQLTYEAKINVNDFETPDNLAGCVWCNDSYGNKNLIIYSYNTVYLIDVNDVPQLFYVRVPREPDPLLYKKAKKFEEWWDEEEEEDVSLHVDYSSKTSVGNCIITSIRVISGKPYIALFNPDYESENSVKCGVYPASINGSNFEIDYSRPAFTLDKQTKIYSFNLINGSWYYTDGVNLYNPTLHSKYELPYEKDDNGVVDDRAVFIDNNLNIYTAKRFMSISDGEYYTQLKSLINYKTTSENKQIASTRNTLMFSDGEYVYNIIDNGDDEINYDLFQICYIKGANDFRLIQSSDAVFIVSKNVIKKIPLYSTLTSTNYGCGYETDTTLNKWYNAAPYYFVSNVLNENKHAEQRDIFIGKFKENFKVELEKLLKGFPDAFIAYTKNKITEDLKKQGVTIEGDDGQILNLIINSVADTRANSFGMYVYQKFMEKIGDDTTYNTFAELVYRACLEDPTNNMTKDFYDIVTALIEPIIEDAKTEEDVGVMPPYLIKYYQTHKGEWAKSMTDLIDIDTVDPAYYDIPLRSTVDIQVPQTTYTYSYDENNYVFDYVPDYKTKYTPDEIKEGYLRDVGSGKLEFFSEDGFISALNSELDSNKQYYIDNNGDYQKIDFSDIRTYYTRELVIEDLERTYYVRSGSGTAEDPYVYSEIYDNETMDLSGDTDYYTRTDQYSYSPIDYYKADVNETYYIKTGAETYSEIRFAQMDPESGITYYARDYVYEEVEKTYEYTIVENNKNIDTDNDTYYTKSGSTYTEVTDVDSIVKLTYYLENYSIIDKRTLVKDDNDVPLYYTDESGDVICYYNPDDELYYTNKEDAHELTEDTSVQAGKDYYKLTGEGTISYTLSEDTEENPEKTYYTLNYSRSIDTSVIPNKAYYRRTDDGFNYELQVGNILSLGSYLEKEEYARTADTSVDSDKDYYTESYVLADSLTDTQYYEIGYEKTSDVLLSADKRYFEIIDYSQFAGEPYYEPEANGNYKQVFILSTVNVDVNKTYYTKSGDTYTEVTDVSTIEPDGTYYMRSGSGTEEDPYIYVEISVQGSNILDPDETYYLKVGSSFERVEYADEQYGPYYIARFKQVTAGTGNYKQVTFSSSTAKPYYLPVQNPQQNNIGKYYEMIYIKVKKPTSYTGYYVKKYLKVQSPNNVDLTDYFEKTDSYVSPQDINYTYDDSGNVTGIVNDRNYYKQITSTGDYARVENPTINDNPFRSNWYEQLHSPVSTGTFNNPHAEGLYEATVDPIRFEKVANPSGNPYEQGWYEETTVYSNVYSENKIYVDLGKLYKKSGKFPPEDDAWHEMFYGYVEEAKSHLPTEEELPVLKEAALEELNKIQYIIYPSWLWQSLITSSVMEYYIPKQGDQFRQIVMDSNMYPIHWDELPSDINHRAFDYALTTLLYMVKQRLLTNISILVDKGTVKCYSCIDGSSVIRKMVEKNGNVWYNQLKKAKKDVNKAATKDEVLKAFDMIKVFNLSLDMLEEILNNQSALYAKYIDMIIEEQVINDNETEVVM